MREFFRRLYYLLNRSRFDRELADDLAFHREMAARAGGMPLGNALHLREEARDAWGWTWTERVAQDLRYAARMLWRSPGFTAAAVLILAIGIGVNVAAFGFFNLMVLRPLPVRDPETLLRFQRLAPNRYASVLPYPEMAFFRENAKTLSAVLAFAPSRLTIEGEEKPINAQFVTGNYFRELGAPARLGRTLEPGFDDAPAAEYVAVLSHGFWQRHFGGDPWVAGKVTRLNGKPVTIIGVAAAGFGGLSLEGPDMWLPIVQQPRIVEGSKLLTELSVEGAGVTVWGRLRPGFAPKAAEDELRSLAAVLHAQHPDDIWENESLSSTPGAYATSTISHSHHGTGGQGPDKLIPIAALAGALVLLILAVACGNLGTLLLARGVAREREIAIRIAVGAGKARLIRQLFTESLLLGLVGALAGLGLGYVVLRALMATAGAPEWLNAAPDWRVVLFAAAMGLAAAVVFGLTPAWQVARQRHRASIMRQVMIGAQVAASCVLLIIAGLLARALTHATADPGFAYQQIVTIDPALGSHGYSPAKARAYLDTLQSRLRELPGVESMASASNSPFGNKTSTIGTEFQGRPIAIYINHVDPRFFRTMKISLLRGSYPEPGDSQSMIVSESLAVLAWPAEDPIGKPFDLAGRKYTVLGVVANARPMAPQEREGAEAYFPVEAPDAVSMTLLVRSAGSPESLAPKLVSIARAIDPKIVPEVQLMKSAFQRSQRGAQYSALAASVLALLSLLLACLGIVGLVAYTVSQRTKEIGIRMALGANPAHIVKIVVGQFACPIILGLLAGIGGAAGLSQLLRMLLYGVGSIDPIAYLSAIGIFAAAAALAAVFPARRALRIDPVRALRNN